MQTLVTNIRQLITPLGRDPLSGTAQAALVVREGVELVLRDDRIAAIVPAGVTPRPEPTIDAGGGVVVPGLVDACVAVAGAADGEPDLPRLRSSLTSMLRLGTTSAEVRAAARPEAADPEAVLVSLQQVAHWAPLRLSSAFLGAPHATAAGRDGDRITTLISETIPAVSRRRLATTCVVACGHGGYARKEARAVLRAARGAGLDLKIQAVGDDADAFLAAADVPVAAIDHLTGAVASPRAFAALRRAGTIVALLPSQRWTRCAALAPARPLVDAGLPLALGSAADLLTGGVLSLWTCVSLAVRELGLSLEEAIVAATLNAACALGISDDVGTLEPGKLADFSILDLADHRAIPDFLVGLPVRTVVVGGRIVAP